MKNRNSISVLFLLLCFVVQPAFAGKSSADWPILSVHKNNGGFFGYDNVSAWLETPEEGPWGYNMDCLDPGFSGCKLPSMDTPDNDPVDEEYMNILWDLAEVKIANGVRTGSSTKKIKVSGEVLTRVYVVTWTSTDVTSRPTETKGDGQSITIIVDREDMQL